MFPQPKLHGAFTFQMQGYSFSEVLHSLIYRVPLGYHGYFDTLGNVAPLLTGSNDRFDSLLQLLHGFLSDAGFHALLWSHIS